MVHRSTRRFGRRHRRPPEAPQDPRYASTATPAPFSAPPTVRPLTTKPDIAVTQARHDETATSESPGRRLAPPTVHDEAAGATEGHASSGTKRIVDFGMPLQSIYTVVTALAIVLGAFLLFAWAIRRGGKNSVARRGSLPSEVVNVLGRVPIAARQFAQLLRRWQQAGAGRPYAGWSNDTDRSHRPGGS